MRFAKFNRFWVATKNQNDNCLRYNISFCTSFQFMILSSQENNKLFLSFVTLWDQFLQCTSWFWFEHRLMWVARVFFDILSKRFVKLSSKVVEFCFHSFWRRKSRWEVFNACASVLWRFFRHLLWDWQKMCSFVMSYCWIVQIRQCFCC